MKGIIDWIRSHLHIVISTSIALIGIALLVLGYMDDSVKTALDGDIRKVDRLSTMKPVNRKVIDAAQKQLEETREVVELLNQQVANIGSHQPLLSNVFPEPPTTTARLDFKGALRRVYTQEFPRLLNAGERPSQAEIDQTSEDMKNAAERLKFQETFGDTEATTTGGDTDAVTTGTPAPWAAPRGFGTTGRRTGETSRRDLENMTPQELVREIPEARISVSRARSIYCYASGNPESSEFSFDPQPGVLDADRPRVEDMWIAQMSLWIQSDMVNAIAAINNRQAQRLEAEQIGPWVGNLPVKRIVRINVRGYVPGDDSPAPGGRAGSAGPVARAGSPLTGNGTTAAVDVLQFDMELVVDARSLPAVIDELCAAGFYTPLVVNFEAEPPNPTLSGYIYGTAPVVRVTLEMEAALPRAKYLDLIPPAIEAEKESGALFQRTKERPGRRSGPGRGYQPPAAPAPTFSPGGSGMPS